MKNTKNILYFVSCALLADSTLSAKLFGNPNRNHSNSKHACAGVKKNKWCESEDQQLIDLVKKYGIKDWVSIAKHIPNRRPKQCRERWLNFINPSRKIGVWSSKEDQILLNKVRKMGKKWTKIAAFLPGRTDNDVKNRWYNHFSRKKNQDFDLPECDFSDQYPSTQNPNGDDQAFDLPECDFSNQYPSPQNPNGDDQAFDLSEFDFFDQYPSPQNFNYDDQDFDLSR
ncbi:MAG: hypothetical protein LBI77_00460 [Puniceicoccales bacterium]|jgi:hypothetical protein|nr:hypothetical protein [Puniceicoccales bacterium]